MISNPPRSPFFKGGLFRCALLPLFGKAGKGEIYPANLWATLVRKFVVALCLATLAACKQQMAEQPRYEPLGKSDFFSDGRSARQPVEGTVARGELRDDEQFYTGNIGGKPAETFPFPVSAEILQRGRQRFDIFCSPCHDRIGNGQGMVVRRGFRAPPSLHIDRLRQAPPGHFFDVMTRGFGTMPSYAEQISTADRWAIAAYIRALQFSQQARLADVPEKERRLLEANP